MNTTKRIAASAALLAALALPLPSPAATTASAPPQHFDFPTRTVDRYHPGEYDGRLTLTIYANGIVQGTYRNDEGRVQAVSGGVDGKSIWFDIGNLHLNGTFAGGALDVIAAIPGPNVFELQSVGVVKQAR